MNYSMHLCLALATLPTGEPCPGTDEAPAEPALADLVAATRQRLLALREKRGRKGVIVD